jgi:hypothetical protein
VRARTRAVAQVRVKPYKSTAKSFPTKAEAKAWAEAAERSLRDLRKQKIDRADLSKLAIKTLVEEYLADSETKALRCFDDLELYTGAWSGRRSAPQVIDSLSMGVQ